MSNLPEAQLPTEDPAHLGPLPPGRYVLPLEVDKDGHYRVAGLPRSPGFDGRPVYFLYPDTPLTRRQLEAIPKPSPVAPGQ